MKVSINNSSLSSAGGDTEFLPWNSPSNIVSFQAYLGTLHYCNVVIKPLVVSAGVVANVVNCLVFGRQGVTDRMNLCLFVQALVEIVFLLYSMAFTVAYWIRVLEPTLGEELYQKTHSYAGGVCSGLRETSSCISVVIAVERCVCVVFPLRANSLLSTRTMGILLVAIVISMQLAFVTTPIKKYVYPVYDNTTGGTRWRVVRAAAWQNSESLLLYDTIDIIMLIVFPFLTFLIVAGATAVTVIKLRVAMSWREKASSVRGDTSGQQVALTKMLVTTSCVFMASKVPFISVSVAQLAYPDFSPFGRQFNAFKVLDLIAYYFPYAHCAVGFFVYYAQSSRFRSEVQRLCRCLRTR